MDLPEDPRAWNLVSEHSCQFKQHKGCGAAQAIHAWLPLGGAHTHVMRAYGMDPSRGIGVSSGWTCVDIEFRHEKEQNP